MFSMFSIKDKKKKREGKPRKPKSEPIESHWADLPDLILERIFSYLTIRQRFTASIVCQRWNDAFYLPYVWSNFVMTDETLIRRKFNYYMGWQVFYIIYK
jgi:F-box protein 39